jgi:hypothetical protein
MKSLLINRWILGLRFSLTSNGLHRSHCEKSEPLRYLVFVSFKNISPTLLESIYKSFVRPICDYAASVGNPYFARDIHSLEQTQCRFTKLSAAIKDLPYEERLVALHLSPMSDLMETYKILHGHYICNLPLFMLIANVHFCCFKLKLVRERFRKHCRR